MFLFACNNMKIKNHCLFWIVEWAPCHWGCPKSSVAKPNTLDTRQFFAFLHWSMFESCQDKYIFYSL